MAAALPAPRTGGCLGFPHASRRAHASRGTATANRLPTALRPATASRLVPATASRHTGI